MTLRINTKTGVVVPLDNVDMPRGLELSEIVKERIALLRVAEIEDIIDGVGVRFEEDVFIVHEF